MWSHHQLASRSTTIWEWMNEWMNRSIHQSINEWMYYSIQQIDFPYYPWSFSHWHPPPQSPHSSSFFSFFAGIFHANYILLGLLGSVVCCWGWLKKVLSTEYLGTFGGAFALMRSSDVERRRIFMVSKRHPSTSSPSSPIYLISHSRSSNQERISTWSMESQMWRKVSSTHHNFSVLWDGRHLFLSFVKYQATLACACDERAFSHSAEITIITVNEKYLTWAHQHRMLGIIILLGPNGESRLSPIQLHIRVNCVATERDIIFRSWSRLQRASTYRKSGETSAFGDRPLFTFWFFTPSELARTISPRPSDWFKPSQCLLYCLLASSHLITFYTLSP